MIAAITAATRMDTLEGLTVQCVPILLLGRLFVRLYNSWSAHYKNVKYQLSQKSPYHIPYQNLDFKHRGSNGSTGLDRRGISSQVWINTETESGEKPTCTIPVYTYTKVCQNLYTLVVESRSPRGVRFLYLLYGVKYLAKCYFYNLKK